MALAGLPENLVAQIRCGKQPQRPVAQPREALLSDDSSVAEGLVHARVHACGALLRAARAAVKILASAGQGLQRSVGAVHADNGFARCLAEGGLPTARLGCDFLDACGGLGQALAGLAAVLDAEVAEPLQEMQQTIAQDSKSQQADAVSLEQEEAVCSAEVREGISKKDKASWDLQNAMQENEKLQNALPGFLSRLTSSKLESQVQQAASLQTAAVEELAAKMDRAALARLQREQGLATFQEHLGTIDGRCVSALRKALERCAGAWAEAGGELQEVARRLRRDASAEAAAAAAAAAAASAAATESGTARLCSAIDEGMLASKASKEGGAAAGSRGPSPDGGRTPGTGREERSQPSDMASAAPGSVPAIGTAEAIAVASIGEAVAPLARDSASAQEQQQEVPQFSDVAASSPDGSPLGTPPGESPLQPSPRPAPPGARAGAREGLAAAEAEAAGPEPGGEAPQPPPGQGQEANSAAPDDASDAAAFVVRFSEQVKRLGFEVLWEDERPKVGNVVSDGAAQKNGLLTGDVLLGIAGTDTLDRSRDELMPLLKVRPLKLRLLRASGKAATESKAPEP